MEKDLEANSCRAAVKATGQADAQLDQLAICVDEEALGKILAWLDAEALPGEAAGMKRLL